MNNNTYNTLKTINITRQRITISCNLVPRLFPCARLGKTLVNAGHVSPRIWEIEIFYYEGGGVRGIFASWKYELVAIQVSYKGSCKQSIPANVTRGRLFAQHAPQLDRLPLVL